MAYNLNKLTRYQQEGFSCGHKKSLNYRCLMVFYIALSIASISCTKQEVEPTVGSEYVALTEILLDEMLPLSNNPLSWEDEDLRFLDQIADKQMVGLGESSHGTAEFFDAKHRIFRYLVENQGYKVFAIEADFGESIFINKAVLEGRAEDIEDLMESKMHFWTWKTKEVQELLEWMCNYNLDKSDSEKVHYMGVDCQFNTFHPDMVKDYLHGKGIPFITFADTILERIKAESSTNFESYSFDSFTPILVNIKALKDSMVTYRDVLISASSEKEFDLTYRLLEVTQQVCEVKFYSDSWHSYMSPINHRDKNMAENAAWLLDYLEHKKMVLWAHNFHVFDYENQNWRTMGNYLSILLEDEYAILGFLFSQGQATAKQQVGGYFSTLPVINTVDAPNENFLNAIMSYTREPAFFIDIGKLNTHDKWKEAFDTGIECYQMGSAHNNNTEHYYREFNPDWLDYLIYFDLSTATELLEWNSNHIGNDR